MNEIWEHLSSAAASQSVCISIHWTGIQAWSSKHGDTWIKFQCAGTTLTMTRPGNGRLPGQGTYCTGHTCESGQTSRLQLSQRHTEASGCIWVTRAGNWAWMETQFLSQDRSVYVLIFLSFHSRATHKLQLFIIEIILKYSSCQKFENVMIFKCF